jgi:two-component system LytT family response regulator
VVRTGPRFQFVDVGEVDWIGAAENYLELHVGGRTFLLRSTMASLESTLDPRLFLRIHRGTIVNVRRIAAVEPWNRTEFVLILKDGQRLFSSRSYRARVAALLR